jgi:hypothetical protein
MHGSVAFRSQLHHDTCTFLRKSPCRTRISNDDPGVAGKKRRAVSLEAGWKKFFRRHFDRMGRCRIMAWM